MFKSYKDRIRDAGIVGAGGAGFPTHVKIDNQADIVIANGAECEPLLRGDQQIMEHFADSIVEGLQVVMKVSKAKRGVICLKAKYKQAVKNLTAAVEKAKGDVSLQLIDNYYPAGDEQQMVFDVTGRVVPVGGLPIQVGAVVCNVSTLMNIADAVQNKPVTHKFVTITGEVKNPMTLNVPIGTSIRTLIRMAGGPEESSAYGLILGGPAMGKVETNWDAPVTKTLGGVLVLPSDHLLLQKKTAPLDRQIQMSKAVCCQCNYCTSLCPRNALGLGTSPHKAMRAIAYGDGSAISAQSVVSCCDCGICTYYACNMGLMPSRVMTSIKGEMMKKRVPFEKTVPFPVDPDREYKRIPVHRFIERLDVARYDRPAPIDLEPISVNAVLIPLKQHIGVPCQPKVAVGDIVALGDVIGDVPEGQLGVPVHASIAGQITAIENGSVRIQNIGG